MRSYVYLCGPITGLSYQDARFGWRKEFQDLLNDQQQHAGLLDEVGVLSPMRQEAHLSELEVIGHHAYDGVMSQEKAIVRKDRLDVQRATIVVANFTGSGERISIGSVVELGWADAMGKTIILVMEEQGNLHDRFFITQLASFRVSTVKEAAEITAALLLPGI